MSYFGAMSRGERPGRAVWLPFMETLAAQVEGCDLGAIVSDATRWANSLPRVAKLLDAKVVAVGFMEGFGADSFADNPEEPWKHQALDALLECARRLAETARPERELVVAMPGMLAVCNALGQPMDRGALEKIKPGLVKLLEMICECRPEMVILNEALGAEQQQALAGADYRRMCNTLKNVAEYFGVALGIRVSGCGDAASLIGGLRALRLDHLMIGRAAAAPVAAAEQAADGQAADGQAADGQAADGQAADGQAADGQAADGQAAADLVAAAEGQGWRSVGIAVRAGEGAIELPQQETGYYWCSAGQEQDLEQARKFGLGLAASAAIGAMRQ